MSSSRSRSSTPSAPLRPGAPSTWKATRAIRFERGVDPAFAGPGMELMTRLVMELCGGEASEVVVAGIGARVAARDRLSPLQGPGARRASTARGRTRSASSRRWVLPVKNKDDNAGLGRAAALARRHPRRGGPCRGSATDCGLRPDPRGLPQARRQLSGRGRHSRPRAGSSVPCAARSRRVACSRR